MNKKLILVILFTLFFHSFLTYAEDDLGDIFGLIGGLSESSSGSTNQSSSMPYLNEDGISIGDVSVKGGEAKVGKDTYVNGDETRNGNLQTEGTNVENPSYSMGGNNMDHYAAREIDNVVYNPFGYIKGDYVYVYYTPGNGVKNVKIFYSYDGKDFIPIITLSTTKNYYHFPVDFSKNKIFVKVLPIDDNGNYGVMKEGVKVIPYIEILLEGKKISDKKIGHAKTGPGLWFLFIFAGLVALYSRSRKNIG